MVRNLSQRFSIIFNGFRSWKPHLGLIEHNMYHALCCDRGSCSVVCPLSVDNCGDAPVRDWLLQLKATQSVTSPFPHHHPQPPIVHTAAIVDLKT